MKKEFFIGYLENPTIIINDDFQEKRVLPVILEKTNDGYIEYKTKEKVFIKEQAVFDGHRFYESKSSFYGFVCESISEKNANTFLNNMTSDYLIELLKLKNTTIQYSLLKEKEYLETVKNFINVFNERRTYAR